MQYLYEIGFVATVLSALGWFWRKALGLVAGFFGKSFWFSLLLYVLGFFFEDVSFFLKLFMMLPVDLAIFVLVIVLVNKYITKSRWLVVLIAAGALAAKLLFFDRMATAAAAWWEQPATATAPPAGNPPLAAQGELLLDLGQGHSLAELQPLLDRHGITARLAFPNLAHPEYSELDDFYVLDLTSNQATAANQAANDLLASGLVDAVETNEVLTLDDPVREARPLPPGGNYGLNDPGVANLWGFQAMQMADLFNLLRQSGAKPGQTAKIAILDTGVDGAHEDLAANFASSGPRNDRDVVGHGTHCAGIAGAVSNNGRGIASFAPNNGFVQITSIKVLSDNGSGTQQDIINGIIAAADGGAAVISMSLGGPSLDHAQRAYAEAVKYANRAGALVVVAAGNSDEDAIDYAPANVPGVITVAAVDNELNKADFSNTVGSLKMGIAAPGVSIYSTVPGNQYKYLNGTSMATPYVAGLLGLAKAMNETAADTESRNQTGGLIQPAKVVERLLAGQ
ncbi:MAG: S8 family serine peptidase [Bernardetiaceae bacterium]|nr:S8 family serine peptidase [Bernardetiaceae bacterium]